MRFIGRESEIQYLKNLYQDKGSKLIVIYGRRRVGKSTLVEEFIRGKNYLKFEGLEKARTKAQISQFAADLSAQLNDTLLEHTKFNSWLPVFDYLTKYFSHQKQKTILFLDEFQWIAANQSKLVSIIKKYWDQHWSKQNVMLILCGSVSSYMIKRVISSKALYGRINGELCLQALNPLECFELLDKKRSSEEILQYSLILGGIPKYLMEINPNKSFEQNINNLFFIQTGVLLNDYSRIFYSQFKEYRTYEIIVRYLKEGPKSLEETAKKLKMVSSGGIKTYLENLEKALFITSYVPYNKNETSKLKKYKLTDEYLRFYFKYVEPYKNLIVSNKNRDLFSQLVKPEWSSWLGFAFENFCLKNALYLAELMGFGDKVINWGPYFQRKDKNFQIDLIYVRSDKVITLCELKYQNQPVDVTVVIEMEKKCKLIEIPRGYTVEKALISKAGPNEAVKQLNYFHHFIQANDFFHKD